MVFAVALACIIKRQYCLTKYILFVATACIVKIYSLKANILAAKLCCLGLNPEPAINCHPSILQAG